jgi:uncharacterized protein YbjQ (UPF0145 family)
MLEEGMLSVTTPVIEGRRVTRYLGIVTGEAILGANIFRDFFAGIRDIVGGRSARVDPQRGITLRFLAGLRKQTDAEMEERLGSV